MEIDFSLIQGRDTIKTFTINNPDGSPFDMFGKTIKCRVYKTLEVDLVGVVSGTLNNKVAFNFNNTVNTDLGVFEYEFYEDTAIDEFFGRGNITWVTATDFTTQILTLVGVEAGALVIPSDYVTQSILYWKLFLQAHFGISDEDLPNDAAWPVLVRFLIAKLVVWSYVNTQIMTGTLAGVSGMDGNGDFGIKKIVTGPTETEYFDQLKTISDMMKPNASGQSGFSLLQNDLCLLAGKLRVSLPQICGFLSEAPVTPLKADRLCSPFTLKLLNVYYQE